jgi:hypothetical protein
MVEQKVSTKNFVMSTYDLIVASLLMILVVRKQSTNSDVVLVARSKSPIDEVMKDDNSNPLFQLWNRYSSQVGSVQ